MTKIIKHQFFFPHPKETVWEYLTKSELLEQWLMKNNFQPIVGHDFQSGQTRYQALILTGSVIARYWRSSLLKSFRIPGEAGRVKARLRLTQCCLEARA
ncbi:MAG: hypothetical protein WDN75_06675 [Bacteroidota bacterium]